MYGFQLLQDLIANFVYNSKVISNSWLIADSIDKSQAATKDLFDELEKERGNIPALPVEAKKEETKKAN
jgi:hypothetical protein